MVIVLQSCTNDLVETGVESNAPPQIVAVNSGVLSFATPDALNAAVNCLKESDSFELEGLPATRSGVSDFVSLRQHLIEQGLKLGLNKLNSWYKSSQGQKYRNNPNGIYSAYDRDRKIAVVFPQGEEVAYDEGREVVRWEMNWFSGSFQVGFSNKGGGWKYDSVKIDQATEVEIKRGRVYGAVKYNNEWRACVIETE